MPGRHFRDVSYTPPSLTASLQMPDETCRWINQGESIFTAFILDLGSDGTRLIGKCRLNDFKKVVDRGRFVNKTSE